MTRNVKYCMDLVRKHDFENYLCNLLLPNTAVRSAFAIRAFNVSLAQVCDAASDKRTQQFRYAYWQDAVRAIHTNRSELSKLSSGESVRPSALNAFRSPVFDELCAAVSRDNLSTKWLSRLVDARASLHLRSDVFVRLGDLEKHADETTCCVLWLLLQSLHVQSVLCDHVAGHLGKAQTLALHVRALPHNVLRQADLVAVPHELLAKHSLSLTDLARLAKGQAKEAAKQEALCNLVHEMASQAMQHVTVARNLYENGSHGQKSASSKHKKPTEALAVFLACVPTVAYLNRLQRVNFNVFHPSLARRDSLLPIRLLFSKYRARF